jgi:hypothetical protein
LLLNFLVVKFSVFLKNNISPNFLGEVGGHKERGNEGEYGGCILYPYIKKEE